MRRAGTFLPVSNNGRDAAVARCHTGPNVAHGAACQKAAVPHDVISPAREDFLEERTDK